ncbi:sugar transferase [hydrothermal vent metagenome]|uniref:Sugar transferase n=1 Tax=hydrothermal vent metagenome TaxID=652676 RepID=A0A1W1BVR0_9ZZZZ
MTFPMTKKNRHFITNYYKKEKLEIKKCKEYTKIQFFQKRLIDFIVGGSLLLVSIPIVLYTIFRIKKESPGSILFKQSRIGLNGKPFMCYKFRSMHVNSKFNPYTQENDTRIFPFGNTMRKMRIDELPQLINIIKGEMHLIGPRAEWDILVKDYEKIIPNYHERHLVAPGITGLAQVCYPYGRNVDDAKKKLEFDIEYITNWSLRKELMVIFKTIKVVLGKEGI